MQIQENHILSKQEVLDLIKSGKKLDDGEDHFYILKFAFNDKWNNAVDPRNFRIKTELVDKLAADMIGTPYTVPEYGKELHIRGTDFGAKDTAGDLVKFQAKYAIGPIVEYFKTPTNNVWAIVDVWPEFRGAVENNLIPPLTSPTINIIKEDADGISDAQFLNLQAVPSSGYPPELTKITAMCKGGIKKCMEELAPIGAAGKLKTSRADEKFFFNRLSTVLGAAMSADPNSGKGNSTPSMETVARDVEGLKSTYQSLEQRVSSMDTKLDAIAAKIGASAPAGGNPPAGAAGAAPAKGVKTETLVIPKELENNEFVKTLYNEHSETKKKVEDMEKDLAAKEEKRKSDMRKAQAESIVAKLILNKKVKEEDKDKEIKKYIELKGEDGQLKDLELLDNFLKSETTDSSQNPPVGAYGYEVPEFGGDHDDETTFSNTEVMELTERN